MKQIAIYGENKISGKIKVSGAKNASLPILMSTLLIDGQTTLFNIPNVFDITTSIELLSLLGSKIEINNNTKDNSRIFILDNTNINSTTAPKEIVNKFRASFWVLGPLLTRFKKCKVALPGGCKIGARPVDIYIETMKQMGAKIEEDSEYITAEADKLIGADITLRLPSVGATHNLIMAATLAEGKTIIRNAAQEPEIVDLAKFLTTAGAKIIGAGTNKIEIEGVKQLHSTQYQVMADRIEAFSYIVSSLITEGDLILEGLDFCNILKTPIDVLLSMGANIEVINDYSIRVIGNKEKMKPTNIKTDFYPGFPTDCQAIIMPLVSNINGISKINETIYENRFMHALEMNKMGADIKIEKKSDNENIATINGSLNILNGTNINAEDIRGGMGLVLAGLSAKGKTIINNIHHIERGYENLVEKLNSCGANVSIIENE